MTDTVFNVVLHISVYKDSTFSLYFGVVPWIRLIDNDNSCLFL